MRRFDANAAGRKSAAVAVLVALLTVGWLALAGSQPAKAFTLVSCVTISVSVTPTSGYPTSALKVDGKCSPGPCGAAMSFTFYWDTTLVFIWSKTVTACDANKNYDTGLSPAFVPVAGYNEVGSHTVILNVKDANGNLLGNGSPTTNYTITSPPPPPKPSPKPPPSPVRTSPQTQPSPTPTPSPSPSPNCATSPTAAGCPSPSASSCPASAGMPPSGTGGFVDNLIAAAMVGGSLSIAAIALFGPGTLFAAMVRRRRLLALIGLAGAIALAVACSSTVATTPNSSPTATQSPSPSACPAAA